MFFPVLISSYTPFSCVSPVETQLAASPNNPYNSPNYTHAVTGFGGGTPTGWSIGFGSWTNTYIKPFNVSIYDYTVGTNSWSGIRETFEVMVPDGTAVAVTHARSDIAAWVGQRTSAIPFYDLRSGYSRAEVAYSWGGTIGGTIEALARRGDVIIAAYSGTMKRWSVAAGVTAQASKSGLSTPYYDLFIHPDNTYGYGIVSTTSIKKFDLATLTEQKTINLPAGYGYNFGVLLADLADPGGPIWLVDFSSSGIKLWRCDNEDTSSWSLCKTFTAGNPWRDTTFQQHRVSYEMINGVIYVVANHTATGIGLPIKQLKVGG